MDTSSHVSTSVSTSVLEKTRAFCVVCGLFHNDLVLRNSGLKCPNCVGHRANKHYVKLQKRQATQLLSQTLTNGGSTPAGRRHGSYSSSTSERRFTGRDRDTLPARSTDSSFSSSAARLHLQTPSESWNPSGSPILGTPSTAVATRATKIEPRPIEEYISSTTAYLDVVQGSGAAGSREQNGVSGGTTTCSSSAPHPPSPSLGPRGGAASLANSASKRSSNVNSSAATTFVEKKETTAPSASPPVEPAGRMLPLSTPQTAPTRLPRRRGAAASPQEAVADEARPVRRRSTIARPLLHASATVRCIEGDHADEDDSLSPRRGLHPRPLPEDANTSTTGVAPSLVPLLPSMSNDASLSQNSSTAPTPAAPGETQQSLRGLSVSSAFFSHPPAPPRAGSCAASTASSAVHSRSTSHAGARGKTAIANGEASPAAPRRDGQDTAPKREEAATASNRDSCSSSNSATSSSSSRTSSCGDSCQHRPCQQSRASSGGTPVKIWSSSTSQRSTTAAIAARKEKSSGRATSQASGGDATYSSSPAVNGGSGAAGETVQPSIDALHITVASKAPVRAASPLPPRLEGRSSGDDASFSESMASNSDSLRRAPRSSSSGEVAQDQQGRFTITRHVSQRSSTADPVVASGLEVKRISFRLQLHDRTTGALMASLERQYYTQIIPALEQVKWIAGDALPSLPQKRLPSLRFATESFVAERRLETEAFLQAVEQSPFFVRHPAVVQLLGLEQLIALSSGGVATTSSQVSGTALSPSNPSVAAVRQRGSSGGGSQQLSGATPAGQLSGAPYLSRQALDRYQDANADGLAMPAIGRREMAGADSFCRDVSHHSGSQSNRSSMVRHQKIDGMTAEDLEKVQLGNLIGRGSFGSVYLGLLQTHQGPLMVAVKVMAVNGDANSEEMAGLQRELDVLCTARHRNIVRFLGSLLTPSTRELRVFTEYVECGTIRSMVHRFGSLSLLAIQKYMGQVLRGLEYLHSLSICHHDIKGENILVTKNGRVKLSDFGSSSHLLSVVSSTAAAATTETAEAGGLRSSNNDSSSSNNHANGGSVAANAPGRPSCAFPAGSPPFMAPEVVRGDADVGVAADIWSLGCVGIEMLDRPIWHDDQNLNPFVFMFRIGRYNTPPHGLPTAEEVEQWRVAGKMEEYEGFRVYRDFLVQCLRVKASSRPTARELQRHPFLSHPYSRHLRWMPPSSSPKPT